MRTGAEGKRERGWRRTKGREMGTGTVMGRERKRGGGGDPWTNIEWERGRQRGRNESSSGDGNGDGDGDGDGNEDGLGEEEKRRSTRNRARLVDAMWKTGEASVEKGENVDKNGLVQ